MKTTTTIDRFDALTYDECHNLLCGLVLYSERIASAKSSCEFNKDIESVKHYTKRGEVNSRLHREILIAQSHKE